VTGEDEFGPYYVKFLNCFHKAQQLMFKV